MVLAVVVVIVLMVKVVPTFTAIFEEQGSELPAITMSLIIISNFFRRSWMYSTRRLSRPIPWSSTLRSQTWRPAERCLNVCTTAGRAI